MHPNGSRHIPAFYRGPPRPLKGLDGPLLRRALGPNLSPGGLGVRHVVRVLAVEGLGVLRPRVRNRDAGRVGLRVVLWAALRRPERAFLEPARVGYDGGGWGDLVDGGALLCSFGPCAAVTGPCHGLVVA